MQRRFHFVEGASSKFWEVSAHDCTVTVCYGRIGTSGQTLIKTFVSAQEADKHAKTLIRQKLGKGYVEQIAA